MIKRFGFRNFSSFKEGAEINFSCKENITSKTDSASNPSKVIGIKGEIGRAHV